MKKFLLRVISSCLLAVILISAVACADNSGSDNTDGAQNGATTALTGDETTGINALNVLGPRDFGGETFTFYSRSYNGAWSSDLIAEDTDATILGTAIYKRNAKLSEQYKINIEEIKSGKQSFITDLGNKIDSDDTSFQALYLGLAEAGKAAQAGYLLDMTEIENIHLDKEWWTQSSNKAWSIGGAQYFATGDITTIDDMSIRCMFFNKDIIADHKLKTVYDLVDDNEWTYDKFFEYVEIAKKDNGDGVLDLNDTYGVAAQVTFGFMMTMASGEMLVKKDADDIPVLAVANDSTRFVDVVTDLTAKISDNEGVYLGADNDIKSLFGNSQALFYAEVLLHAQTMRMEYDMKFGIVPMPKYNSDQKDYYQYTTGYCTCVVAFPNNVDDDALDMASFMVEAMAVESVETVTPAYYEVCLKGRYADDYESARMLDIITTSVSSDLAEIFGWGGFKTSVQDAISAGNSIVNILTSKGPQTERIMRLALKDFEDLK